MSPAILIIVGVILLYLVITGRAAAMVRAIMTGRSSAAAA